MKLHFISKTNGLLLISREFILVFDTLMTGVTGTNISLFAKTTIPKVYSIIGRYIIL